MKRWLDALSVMMREARAYSQLCQAEGLYLGPGPDPRSRRLRQAGLHFASVEKQLRAGGFTLPPPQSPFEGIVREDALTFAEGLL